MPREHIQAAQAAFMQSLPTLSGQARRVAKRFALVAVALELSGSVTGLPQGIGMTGIKQCFDNWLAINGTGKQEDCQIIKQVETFLQMYGAGERFAS